MSSPSPACYSGHSHSFDVGIAASIGLHAAIVFNHIVYWLRINASKEVNLIDGKTWMYETQADMAKCLDYMSLEEVKKATVKLLDAGLLIKANYNKNPFDKTAWYTTSDQEIIRIKKTLSKAPYGAIGGAPGRDPMRPTAPSLYTHKEQQEEQQEEHATQRCVAPKKKGEDKEEEASKSDKPTAAKPTGPIDIRGRPIDIDESQIYLALGSKYDAGTIRAAIDRVRKTNSPIGNVLKLTQTICDVILIESNQERKTENKKATKRTSEPPEHAIRAGQGPTVNLYDELQKLIKKQQQETDSNT